MKFRKLSFKRSRPFNNPYGQEKSGKPLALSQLLLVLAGGLVGVLGNQFFFERNRRFETSIELEREFVKQQLPLYNRIINFTYLQEISGFSTVHVNKNVNTMVDPFGLVYGRDTTYRSDTTSYLFPTFIFDSVRLKDLQNDLRIISENKDKIDPHVWGHFAYLASFFYRHPIPSSKSTKAIMNNTWSDSNTYSEWRTLNTNLYKAANEKLKQFLKK